MSRGSPFQRLGAATEKSPLAIHIELRSRNLPAKNDLWKNVELDDNIRDNLRDHQNMKYQQVHSDKPISMV